MHLQRFLGELKRRNVYRVAAAYAVVGWLLIQIATQVFPFFEVPTWGVRLIILLILAGFPFALIFAWAYELTPEGLKPTEAVAPGESITRSTGRKLDIAIIAVLSTVIAALLLMRYWPLTPKQDAGLPEKSVAVLPFENRSEEKANAYFADGLQDEILTRLSKIAELKVISRMSTEHYRTAPENLPEIARRLGVAYVLGGSVQRSGDSVRVNVQLIRGATDAHVWAESFDRKLTDVLTVQSDVARAVANQLRAHLSAQEEQLIAARATVNVEAYDAYLRGLAYAVKPGMSAGSMLGAQRHLREAVRIDPQFALAWALLSYIDSLSYLSLNLQPTEALREEARHAAETALKLQPNLGEALHAIAFYHYACLKDYDRAVRYFEQARRFLPNSSLVPLSLALVARRQGQWDRSEMFFDEAERLDPLNVKLLTQRALSYIQLRQFPRAIEKLDQVLNVTPQDIDTLALKGAIAQAEGDLPRAASLLSSLRPNAESFTALEQQVYQAILLRNTGPMVARLRELLTQPDPALGYINGELQWWLGWAEEVGGDHTAAQQSWRRALNDLQQHATQQPHNFVILCDLALVHAGLGDMGAAVAAAEKARAMTAAQKDAIVGALPLEILARVLARGGDAARAIPLLEDLITRPYDGALASGMPLTPALLRLDPAFDKLRGEERFARLVGASPVQGAGD